MAYINGVIVFRRGGILVQVNSFAFTAMFLRIMEKEQVSGLPGEPTLFAVFFRFDSFGLDISSLR